MMSQNKFLHKVMTFTNLNFLNLQKHNDISQIKFDSIRITSSVQYDLFFITHSILWSKSSW